MASLTSRGLIKTKSKLTYFLGVCVPSPKQNAAKVRVPGSEFDNHLLMHFPKHQFLFAADPNKLSKVGDVVLIQSLPRKLTRIIGHQIMEVVYPLGDITDPVSGEKIVCGQYRRSMDQDIELFGKLESTFDYTQAPPRGVTQGKRDFSDKEIYVKYNELPDEEEDPYSVRPHRLK